jgi:hypothetical protein
MYYSLYHKSYFDESKRALQRAQFFALRWKRLCPSGMDVNKWGDPALTKVMTWQEVPYA